MAENHSSNCPSCFLSEVTERSLGNVRAAKAERGDGARQRGDGQAVGLAPKRSVGVSRAGAQWAARRTSLGSVRAAKAERGDGARHLYCL